MSNFIKFRILKQGDTYYVQQKRFGFWIYKRVRVTHGPGHKLVRADFCSAQDAMGAVDADLEKVKPLKIYKEFKRCKP